MIDLIMRKQSILENKSNQPNNSEKCRKLVLGKLAEEIPHTPHLTVQYPKALLECKAPAKAEVRHAKNEYSPRHALQKVCPTRSSISFLSR